MDTEGVLVSDTSGPHVSANDGSKKPTRLHIRTGCIQSAIRDSTQPTCLSEGWKFSHCLSLPGALAEPERVRADQIIGYYVPLVVCLVKPRI